jgi:hypothetical protein
MAKRENYEKDYSWYKVKWSTGLESFESIHNAHRPGPIYRIFITEEEDKRAKLYQQEPRGIVEVIPVTYSEYLRYQRQKPST